MKQTSSSDSTDSTNAYVNPEMGNDKQILGPVLAWRVFRSSSAEFFGCSKGPL